MNGEAIYRVGTGNPFVFGVVKDGEDYNFTIEIANAEAPSLLLYKKGTTELLKEVFFEKEDKTGNVFSMKIRGLSDQEFEYNYQANEKRVMDFWADTVNGRESFGTSYEKHAVRYGISKMEQFDWKEDSYPNIPFAKNILYKVHVRGYTKMADVSHPGTFQGLEEMIPYWKSLGVNAIELMPAYEFEECKPVEKESLEKVMVRMRERTEKVNFWGYLPGNYLAVKKSYAFSENAEEEFCSFVRALHTEGMECILEFYIPEGVPPFLVVKALQKWRFQYHVDGFHLTGAGVPIEMLLRDAVLADVKLILDSEQMSGAIPKERRDKTACISEDFPWTMRKFLKSDTGVLPQVMNHIQYSNANSLKVHYITDYKGFTLKDLVSYNEKHNERNGENNCDGISWNASWNCGTEGDTEDEEILKLRLCQRKNAMAMLLLTQGIPVIYGGDEFGNSQNGNNNAYCQDNELGWISWEEQEKEQELTEFVKQLIQIRKQCSVITANTNYHGHDTLGIGYPDLSFHGKGAWLCPCEEEDRLLGVLYHGAYGEEKTEKLFYIGYNFYWEKEEAALPVLPKGYIWEKLADTKNKDTKNISEKYHRAVELSPRSIIVMIGKQEEE